MILYIYIHIDFCSSRNVNLGINKFAISKQLFSSHCCYITHQPSRWKYGISHSESAFPALIIFTCFPWSFIFHCQSEKGIFISIREWICVVCTNVFYWSLEVLPSSGERKGRWQLFLQDGKGVKWDSSHQASHALIYVYISIDTEVSAWEKPQILLIRISIYLY